MCEVPEAATVRTIVTPHRQPETTETIESRSLDLVLRTTEIEEAVVAMTLVATNIRTILRHDANSTENGNGKEIASRIVDQIVGRFVDRIVGQIVGRIVDLIVGRIVDQIVGQIVDLIADQIVGLIAVQIVGQIVDRRNGDTTGVTTTVENGIEIMVLHRIATARNRITIRAHPEIGKNHVGRKLMDG